MPIICEIREKKLTCENIWKPFLLVSKIVVTVYWFSFFSGTTQIVKFSQFVHRHFNTKTENQKQTWYKTTKKLLSSQHEYYCSKPTSIIRYHWYHMKQKCASFDYSMSWKWRCLSTYDGSESTFSLTHAHHIHRNVKTAHLPAEILIISQDNGTFPSELFLSYAPIFAKSTRAIQ